MRYFDIHVQYGNGDGDGYSIPIAIENGDADEAIEKAISEEKFCFDGDVECIDYVEEIDEDEYLEMV